MTTQGDDTMYLSHNPTQDRLMALCRRAFPDCVQHMIGETYPIASRQHEMIAFKWGGRTPDGRLHHAPLIMRRYISTLSWWRPDDRGKAQRETTICRWLHDEGFPVPQVYLREFGPRGDVVLFSWLPGQALPVGERPLREAVEPYIDAFALLLADLHRLEPPRDVQRVVPRVSLPGALANLAALAASIGTAELSQAVEMVMERAYDVPEVGPVLIHGDYHLLNARLQDGEIVGLVDWEYSALGDPRWDVANAYMQLVDFGAADAADRFLSIYLDASGWEFEGEPLYNIVVPLQQWALSEWLIQQQAAGEMPEFSLAQDLIALRDAYHHRAEMALQWLGR
ncbi:MAG TPA: aminoglycoside phosphotransferase family protein [Aggregatilineales bacterium]|nr:aminoglycoside phosphotransferase family protein [Aggregatilineales bacterium]HPV05680.1 aminoglycoside phosphotransferase family protein [Aggregatilineales bacterium]HQA66853.1 aminoglycoside phosphotransferase family protein [Aggregatilineales bacterium]HQE17809.1 aminoglycoside phosphotransferase family protein [Aggregatilineales bacterium]